MASQTELAVLGALSVEPMSGYAIREAVTSTLGHFWNESFGQIYPTLARLEADGLVSAAEPGRTSGSTYKLTTRGRRRLVRLLRDPIASTPPRDGVLLRLFFGRLLGPDVCAEIVQDARSRAVARLEALSRIRDEIRAEGAADADYWLITVSAGEHVARAQIAWAEETLRALRRMT